jgi:hypothetical protein
MLTVISTKRMIEEGKKWYEELSEQRVRDIETEML